jgi:hypothetical protein
MSTAHPGVLNRIRLKSRLASLRFSFMFLLKAPSNLQIGAAGMYSGWNPTVKEQADRCRKEGSEGVFQGIRPRFCRKIGVQAPRLRTIEIAKPMVSFRLNADYSHMPRRVFSA